MAKKLSTRRELLDRWRVIEEESDEDDDRIEPSKRNRLHKNKEQWYYLSLLYILIPHIRATFFHLYFPIAQSWPLFSSGNKLVRLKSEN